MLKNVVLNAVSQEDSCKRCLATMLLKTLFRYNVVGNIVPLKYCCNVVSFLCIICCLITKEHTNVLFVV